MSATRQPTLRERLDARLPGNRRLHLAVAAAVLVVVCLAVAALALRGGGERPPAADATQLVPQDALVYVHLSTDAGRKGTREAKAVAEGFPSYEALRDRLLRQLSAPRCPVGARDVRGKEAALALLDASGGTAGSLVLVDTGTNHPDPAQHRCGLVSVRYIGRFLAIGQAGSLAAAQALADGKGRSLADNPSYRKATGDLPAGRVADAWASADGLRRLLAPQGGILGAAGVLLDRPGLVGTAAGLSASGDRARLTIKSIVDPRARGRTPLKPFEPKLAGDVPSGAMAYLGVKGIGDAAGRLLTAAGSGGAGVDQLLGGLRKQLGSVAGRLDPQLLQLLREEVAIVITPQIPAPTLTLIAHAADEQRTRAALTRIQAPLVKLLSAGGSRQAGFRTQEIAGVKASVLTLGPGTQLAYAVFDHKLVVSTRLDGIAQVRTAGKPLTATDAFKATVGKTSNQVTSVVFLDFSQLLRLGEQTGLNDSRRYQAVKDDLQKVRAVGARASGSGDESTVEIVLEIT